MKNFSKVSLFVIFFSFLMTAQVFAVDDTKTTKETATTQAIPLATVNIQDSKIISQEGSTFKVSFSISNREGLQTGVKYGVRLYSLDKDGQIDSIVGEKIYDEILTLVPASIFKKEVVYIAPSILKGKYSLMLLSYNAQNFPFAFTKVGNVNLVQAVKGVEILNDTCFVTISSEKTHHQITEIINLKKEDTLHLNCEVVNYDSKSSTLTPVYETRLGGSYGNIVSGIEGDVTSLVLKASEKKNVSFLVPTKSNEPQIYNISFSLKENDNISNIVSILYNIEGTKATIYNMSLDKNTYKRGDIAKVSVFLKLTKSPVVADGNPSKYYLNTNIFDSKNQNCGDSLVKEIDQNFSLNFDFNIKKTCNNPKIVASITDDKGTVLSQIGDSNVKGTFISNYKYIVLGIILLILIAVLVIVYQKKKNGKIFTPIAVLIFFFSVSLFANLLFVNKASADTFCLTRLSSCDVLATVSTDKSTYQPGETITAGGFMTSDLYKTAYLYGWPSSLNHSLKVTQSSTTKTIIDSTSFFISDSYSSVTFTAPSTSGSYSLSFTSGVGCNAYYRFATIPDGTDGGCSTPGITSTGNRGVPSDTASPRYRSQQFMVNAGVAPGDVYSLTVYSHTVSVTAVAGDTQSSIVTKLVSAINNTTAAQWNEYGSASYTGIGTTSYGTYSFNGQTKPYAPRPNSGAITFDITLNWQNQFGASASPASSTGDWKYASYNLNYSVAGNQPDLTSSSLTGPDTLYAASTSLLSNYSATISNIGSASTGTGTFPISHHVNKGSNGSGPAVTSGSKDIPALAVGGTYAYNGSQAFGLAFLSANGSSYSERICADYNSSMAGSVVTESNETNNCGPWHNFTLLTAPAPVVTVWADKSSVANGTGTTINWTSTYASSCNRNDTGASVGLSGSFATGNLSATKTFSITCHN